MRAFVDTRGLAFARGLGWLSIGLGVTGLTRTRRVVRTLGVPDRARNRGIVRAVGVRAIASGIGLLAQTRPAGWAWTRLAGDVIDLALLGVMLRGRQVDRARVAGAAGTVAGLMLVDLIAGTRLTGVERPRRLGQRTCEVRQSVTILARPAEVYARWRDLPALPRFMINLASVTNLDGRRSRWTAHTLGGKTLGWTVEIIEDVPGERIAWRSIDGEHAGVIRFVPAPAGRGTEVLLQVWYATPKTVARLVKHFGEQPAQQLQCDLRRLKQLIETGEIVHSDASIHRGPHPARPDPRLGPWPVR